MGISIKPMKGAYRMSKSQKESPRKGYAWPSSALTTNEMRILKEMRDKTGMPISQLLRQAVVEFKKSKD